MSAFPQKHLFSVTDWHTMEERGLFLPETRAELIEGEIIDMPSLGSTHAGCVSWLNNFFNSRLTGVAIVNMQNPIQLGDFSEPQPDIAVLRPDADFYRKRHPTATEVLLLIEVSDSSVNYDRKVKMPLYARYGIVEYWLVNLVEECIEVYLNPQAGEYAEKQVMQRGGVIVPSQFPQMTVMVSEVLG